MLNIGSKVYRNLPEQVAENIRQIAKIWEKLDGLNIYDNVVVLATLDPLTPEQLEILSNPVSFIVYSNNVYMKRGVSGSDILFDKVYQVSESSGTITFDSSELAVTYPLGTISSNNLTSTTYTTLKIDELLNLKADKSDTYTKAEVLDKCYPVGSIYFSTNNTSPASIYGGTWNSIIEGHKLVLESNLPVIVGARNTELVSVGATIGWSRYDNLDPVLSAPAIGITGGSTFTGTDPAGQGFNYGLVPNNLYAKTAGSVSSSAVYAWVRVA